MTSFSGRPISWGRWWKQPPSRWMLSILSQMEARKFLSPPERVTPG